MDARGQWSGRGGAANLELIFGRWTVGHCGRCVTGTGGHTLEDMEFGTNFTRTEAYRF